MEARTEAAGQYQEFRRRGREVPRERGNRRFDRVAALLFRRAARHLERASRAAADVRRRA